MNIKSGSIRDVLMTKYLSPVNLKYLYQCVGGIQTLVECHQLEIYKSTALKREEALIGKLFD